MERPARCPSSSGMADRAHRAPRPQTGPLGRRAAPACAREPDHEAAAAGRQPGGRRVRQRPRVQRVKEGDGPSTRRRRHPAAAQRGRRHARLAITGHFDAATTAATKAFQKKLITEKQPGVTEDGIVDGLTHAQLNAPRPVGQHQRQRHRGRRPGQYPGPADDPAAGPPTSSSRPGPRASAVKELQERLNSSGAAARPEAQGGRRLRTEDRRRAQGLPDRPCRSPRTGSPTPPPGPSSRSAGAASQGHVEFDWREEVEGVKNVGRPGQLRLEAVQDRAGHHRRHQLRQEAPRTSTARSASGWPTSRRSGAPSRRSTSPTPRPKSMTSTSTAKRGGKDHTVNVLQFDPTLTKADRTHSRSNSGTWYTIDTGRSMRAARVRPPDRAGGRVQPDRGALPST